MAVLLLRRLVSPAAPAHIKSLTKSAHSKLRSVEPQPSANTPSDRPLSAIKERLCLHLEYHPNGFPRGVIRQIYNVTCMHAENFWSHVSELSKPPPCISLLTRGDQRMSETYFVRGGLRQDTPLQQSDSSTPRTKSFQLRVWHMCT